MFSKLALFAAASMTVFVAALPSLGALRSIENSCNGGTIQCCNSYAPSSSSAVQNHPAVLGAIIPTGVTAGLTCTPINVLGGGQQCTSQTVCCDGNNFSGAVVLGCNPIDLNL